MFDLMPGASEEFAGFFGEVLRVFVECLANNAGDVDTFNLSICGYVLAWVVIDAHVARESIHS
jgi:hypothetical protein